MPSEPIYVRIKRHNQTFFIDCQLDETIYQLKQKLEKLVSQQAEDIQLYTDMKSPDMYLVDGKTLQQQEIQNDQVLYMVFRLSGEEGFENDAGIASEGYLAFAEEEQ